MQHFEIKKGEWPSLDGVLMQSAPVPRKARAVAFRGVDFPGLRPAFEVEEGGQIAQGQVVFRDRKHPSIAFVAPVSGRVSSLAYGPRRTLSTHVIEADEEDPALDAPAPLEAADANSIRATLLERGMWSAFRSRPFGRMPAPDAVPDAIFVNAVHAHPNAPDPRAVLADQPGAFRLGVSLLTPLTEGEVFLCQSPGDEFGPFERPVVSASFEGSLAAGLAGTHIDRLYPAGQGRNVWTIGYQDVVAIGHLFQTGCYYSDRVVSVGGHLVQAPLGTDLGSLMQEDSRNMGFLGRFDDRVHAPVRPSVSSRRSWQRLFKPTQSALIPTAALEGALAVDVLPVPLMRALSVGDSEAAERLGCLALVEEDVAALSKRCTSGADYARLLRDVLNDLMAEAA